MTENGDRVGGKWESYDKDIYMSEMRMDARSIAEKRSRMF